MPLIEIPHPTPREIYEDPLWVRRECYRYYVQQRRKHCTFLQILDLWMVGPICVDCGENDPAIWRPPDVTPGGWEADILIEAGPEALRRVKRQLRRDRSFALLCRMCRRELRPWDDDEFYVSSYQLEEQFLIPTATPGRRDAARKLRTTIFKLYGNKCFACGSKERSLHIDHILPRSRGGDAAFRNLQPLCESCGAKKADRLPMEVELFSTMHFGPYPSDSYEGLFW